MLPCCAHGILYTHSCGPGTVRFQEDRNVQTKAFALGAHTEESNLEDAQGGRKVELGNMEPQLVSLGAVVLGNESVAPVGR